MSLRSATSIFAGICLLISATAIAAPSKARPDSAPRMFGKGHVFAIWDLPRGHVRETMERLPLRARERAMDWLKRFEFPAADLEHIQVDEEGAVFYAEPVPDFPEKEPETAQVPGTDDGSSEPVTAAAAAADNAFLLHSRPGSPNVVYLDFDGHEISGTAWNSSYDPLYAKSFDLDGDPSTFNEAERAAIAEIWHRVAEDFAAFDIDVTTEEPLSFDRYTGRVLITSKTDANGRAMPQNSGGGVAYIGVWGGSTYASRYSPALVYYDNLGKATTYIAEGASHEFGHNLGLSHDGGSGTSYYSGHGSGFTSWAPIMGNPYSKNVTQWSKGEYSGANNTQDDIAVITAALGLAEDDHPDGLSTATPLVIDSDGLVVVSDPEVDPDNFYPENKGVIDSPDDWDYFSFTAADGSVDLTVKPSWQAFYRDNKRGGNLDVKAILLDGDGNVIVESDPTSDTYASVSASVSSGSYFLAVTGVGNGNYSDYASQGQYFISGSLASSPNTPPIAGFSSACTELNCSFMDGSSDSDGSIVSWSWDFGDGNSSTAQSPIHSYLTDGNYTVALTVTDDDGAIHTVSQSVELQRPLPAILQCLKRYKWERCTVALGQNPPTAQSSGYIDAGDSSDALGQADIADDAVTETIGQAPAVSVEADTLGATLLPQPDVADGEIFPVNNLLSMPGTYLSQPEGAWTDSGVSLALSSNGDDVIGLMFRIAGSNNYYRLYWDNRNGSRRLEKEVNGSFALVAEDGVPHEPGQVYQVEIKAVGNLIEMSIDGVMVFSVQDDTVVADALASKD